MPEVRVQVVNQPTVISTFAGCGGSSLGYKLAGFKELLAVEWDDNAVETFKLNFPEVSVYHGDIADLTGEECLRLAGISKGELDVFDGSPPCQGFSTAGKRKFDDPRNSLFKEYARLLAELQPRVFVFENVTGMVKGCMKQAYLTIIKTLRECGYKAKGEVMNAMYYNVPQSWERVILIGVREDLGIAPTHPKPQTKPIPLRDVLPSLAGSRSQRINPFIPAHRPAATLCKTSAGYQGLPAFDDSYAKLWPRVPVGGNAGDLLGKGHNSCVKVNPDRPSPTLPKMQTGRGYATICHPLEPRALTIEEAKIIGSFPADFKLSGAYAEQWARIGNSVPPNLMRAIATHIREKILA
jgi:DNA (cytosine-5)-methyltransferase 1